MKTVLALITLLVTLASPTYGGVDDKEHEERRGVSDRFSISVGGFLKRLDTGARLDSETLGPGTRISFEDDLGLPKNRDDVRLDGFYRFGRRHRVEFGYMFWSRETTVTLAEQIQYGDEIFDVDAVVRTNADTQIAKLAYKYSIVNNGRVDFGVSGGVSTFFFDNQLEAEGTVGGMGGSVQRESEKLTAPVPMLGTHVDVTIRPKLFFRVRGEIFDLEVADLDSKVIDAQTSIDFFPFKHVGIGVGYNVIDIDLTDTSDETFVLDWRVEGIQAYASFIF